jgi:hypothetical protein
VREWIKLFDDDGGLSMRTVFVKVTTEPNPCYLPVQAEPAESGSTHYRLAELPRLQNGERLEFGKGDIVRVRSVPLKSPDSEEDVAKRLIAVEKIV